MSAPSAIWSPPPYATPWIAAITGTGTSFQTHAARCAWFAGLFPLRSKSSRRGARSPLAGAAPAVAAKLAKSRPAENARPSPERTTARTPRSAES
jgi:hypothetical protein